MPRYICKFPVDGTDYYLEWSSIVDAPVTYGMTLDEFRCYYQEEYGNQGMKGLDERLQRVDEIGHSDRICREPIREWIKGNRAGKGEKEATYDEIIDTFIRSRM